MKPIFAIALGLSIAAPPASAQVSHTTGVTISDNDLAVADLFVEDYSVLDGQVCIGNGCASNVLPHQNTELLLKSSKPTVDFTDTSTNPGFPSNDWQLRVNDPGNGGLDRFSIRDATADTIPFTILGGARDNALTVDASGDVGIGTLFPFTNLHIIGGDLPTVRLEQSSAGGRTPYSWDQYVGDNGTLLLFDRTNSERRMVFKPSTSDLIQSLDVDGEGNLVLTPPTLSNDGLARLHLRNNDGTAKALVEELSVTTSPRTLLSLQNNGRPEIVMGNSDTGGEWSFGAGTNFVLKQGAVGTASSAKTKLFEIQSSGNAVLTGSLTTGGTTCGGGCDLVFSEGYDLPSISQHAEAMFTLGHLPNVGPTPENTPINVSDKLGRMLNELEHAHIYIAELEQANAAQNAAIAALQATVAELVAARD